MSSLKKTFPLSSLVFLNLTKFILLFSSGFMGTSALHAEDFNSVFQNYETAIEQQDFKAALPLAEQAFAMGKAIYGVESENSLNLRYNLANVLTQNNLFEPAYEHYVVVEQGMRNLHGDESEQVFGVQLSQFYALSRTGSGSSSYLKKANRLGKELVNKASRLADNSPNLAADYAFQIVSTFQKSGLSPLSLRKMTKFVEDAEQNLTEKYGADDIRVIETRFYLSSLLMANNKPSAASEKLESIVTKFERALDFSHPWELVAHARLVGIYEGQGKSEKATKHCLAIGQMTPWSDDDIEPTPLFRVNPEYPINYARLRRNGSVKLTFDISEYGFVTNAKVIESEGGELFEEKSIEALQKWRYAPKFVDGEPQIAQGMRVQLDFMIGS